MTDQNSKQVTSTEEENEEEIPMGYRFHPTAFEVIQYYLLHKLMGLMLPSQAIIDLDVDQFDPDQLPYERFENVGSNKGYFFAPPKKRNSSERRDTPKGYWQVDEEKVVVYDSEKEIIGFKDKLTFYNCNNIETDWKMTEYRCNLDGKKDVEEKYVVCKVRLKNKLEETYAGEWIEQIEEDEEDSDEDGEDSGDDSDNDDIARFEQAIRL